MTPVPRPPICLSVSDTGERLRVFVGDDSVNRRVHHKASVKGHSSLFNSHSLLRSDGTHTVREPLQCSS